MPATNCQFCGEPVSYAVAGNMACCTKPACKQAAFRLKAETEIKNKAQAHRQAHQRDIAEARAYICDQGWSEDEAEAVSIGLVPFTSREVKPADKGRQAEFLDNLEKSLRTYLAPDYVFENRMIDYGPPGFDDAHIAACTACRGDCCEKGGTHAFLQPYRLEKLIDRNEENALELALERYASYLPDESIEGSCVFHTKTGCVLPKDIRADECNRFRCTEMKAIEALVETPGSGRLVAVAMKDGKPRNFAAVKNKAD